MDDELYTTAIIHLLLKRVSPDARDFPDTDDGFLKMCGSGKLNKYWKKLKLNPESRDLKKKESPMFVFYNQYAKEFPRMQKTYLRKLKNADHPLARFLDIYPETTEMGVKEFCVKHFGLKDAGRLYDLEEKWRSETGLDDTELTEAQNLNNRVGDKNDFILKPQNMAELETRWGKSVAEIQLSEVLSAAMFGIFMLRVFQRFLDQPYEYPMFQQKKPLKDSAAKTIQGIFRNHQAKREVAQRKKATRTLHDALKNYLARRTADNLRRVQVARSESSGSAVYSDGFYVDDGGSSFDDEGLEEYYRGGGQAEYLRDRPRTGVRRDENGEWVLFAQKLPSLKTPLHYVSGHAKDPSDVGVGEVGLNVVNSKSEVDPSLKTQAHQPHGLGGHADVLELSVGKTHASKLLGSSLQGDDVSKVAVEVANGVSGPLDKVDGMPGLAARVEHPQSNVGLELSQLSGGDLPPHQSVKVDGLVLFDISPVQSGLQSGSPPVNTSALGRSKPDEHLEVKTGLYLETKHSKRDHCIRDGISDLRQLDRGNNFLNFDLK